jgi:hypothetical protein
MALSTVANYVAEARRLLQDETSPFRTSTSELQDALGMALLEARRLRPDLFAGGIVQNVDSGSSSSLAITVNQMYRVALVYYMVGHALLKDEEEGQQQLARTYKQQFGAQLVSLAV